MELRLERRYRKESYTVGRLFADGRYVCDTLEDTDRGLRQDMDAHTIMSRKVYGSTAIPSGTYDVQTDVVSPRFGSMPYYMNVCRGRLPMLKGVKGFDGILIHCGATADNTDGCILVGRNKAVGRLTDSKECFSSLYELLSLAVRRGEKILLTIE